MTSHVRWCLLGLLLAAAAASAATLEPTMQPPGTQNENVFTEEHLKWIEGEFERINPTHVGGEELFEGDILLTPEQRQLLLERKATPDLGKRWTNGADGFPEVPFIFQDDLVDEDAVYDAINHWQEHTCLKFTEKTASEVSATPHLQFLKGGGCWSYVGMMFSPGQQISIGNGCTGLGTVAHEIGHAIGFNHEQSRSDRDDYVVINYHNIISGKESNFQDRIDNNYSVPYDFSSDMHYGSRGFTIDGGLTIATKNPLAQELIGQRDGLSHYDKLLPNKMYPCIESWLEDCGLTSDPCQNDGYTGSDCNCVCPSGTSGSLCETISQDYYENLLSECSKIVTTAGTITSPNYPDEYPTGLRCVKWIQAPECHTVDITFNAFKLYGRNPYCDSSDCCYFDALEIRTSNLYDGEIYCDSDIEAGTTFSSPTDQLILYFETRTDFYSGWSADVAFIPVSGCTTATSSTTSTTSTTTTTPTTTTTTPTTTTTTSTTTTTPTTTTISTTTTTPTTTTTMTTPTTTPTTTTTTTTPTTTSTTTTPTTTTTTTTTPTTTSTTTTPTTTPTTTTPTTTTTTTTPTTTTTTSSTTTPLINEDCNEELVSSTKLHWTSPFFGQNNYPNNTDCSLFSSSSRPSWARITFNAFNLEISTGCVYDYGSFTQPFTFGNKRYCGEETGEVQLASSNFDARFLSDNSVTDTGFNITISQETSNCHTLIEPVGIGSTGVIKPPRRANNIWEKKACEWWIKAPAGMQIKLKFLKMRLTSNCNKSSVIVNAAGDKAYPSSSSNKYCGKSLPPTITSVGDQMNVLFFTKKSTKKFKARWTVV